MIRNLNKLEHSLWPNSPANSWTWRFPKHFWQSLAGGWGGLTVVKDFILAWFRVPWERGRNEFFFWHSSLTLIPPTLHQPMANMGRCGPNFFFFSIGSFRKLANEVSDFFLLTTISLRAKQLYVALLCTTLSAEGFLCILHKDSFKVAAWSRILHEQFSYWQYSLYIYWTSWFITLFTNSAIVVFTEPVESVSLYSVCTQDYDNSNSNNKNNNIIITIRWIIRQWDVRVWNGWSWLRIGTSSGHL